jgi:hypothetical protein
MVGLKMKMTPRYLCPERFQAVLTNRTERSILLRRHIYAITITEGFALQDSDGVLWRPVIAEGWQTSYFSDGATIPYPLAWFVPALDPLRYRLSSMGIHDPACRCGKLQRWAGLDGGWQVVDVSRAQADELLRIGIIAEGGWRATAGAYWCGVRVGAALGVGRR